MNSYLNCDTAQRRQTGRVRVVEQPAAEPLGLLEVKNHLRVDADITVDDALITSLIVAARQGAEHLTGRSLITQKLEMALDSFDQVIELLRSPVQSVDSVKFIDTNGVVQTIATNKYVLDDFSTLPRLVPVYGYYWPQNRAQANAVTIAYTAGYGTADAVPREIKQWMLLRIGVLYENRESVNVGNIVTELPFVDRLLDPYRVWSA